MEGFKQEIIQSSKELTKKEQLQLTKEETVSLDRACEGQPITIVPVMYAVVHVTNPQSENKEYEKYLVQDEDGTIYHTSSKNFFDSFLDICTDMSGENEEWAVKIFKRESKNYKGKSFITCSVV